MPKKDTRKMYADAAFEYILKQLQNLNETDSPLQWIACLFAMKDSFAKHPIPGIAKLCFERNITDILMRILKREFHHDDKTNEAVLYSLAMELIWRFSSLERKDLKLKELEHLISEPFLGLVAGYMDVGHSFYQFPPAMARRLNSLCCDTQFPGQKVTSVPMTSEIWQDILRYCQDTEAVDATSLYYCHLTATQQQTRIHNHSTVAKLLIADGLAWPTTEQLDECTQGCVKNISQLIYPEEKQDMLGPGTKHSHGEKDNTQDVFFLRSIGGPYFWAYVGSDVMNTVQSISQLLKTELPKLPTCTPSKGDLVAAVVDVKGRQEVRRARVMQVDEGQVQIVAVDHGSVHSVLPGQIFKLSQSNALLQKFDAQAKLCCLTGIQAPPVEEAAVELAVCVFVNLVKYFKCVGQVFQDTGWMNYLRTLIRCAPATIQLQAVRLLANLTSWSCCRKIELMPFIKDLIEILCCIMEKEELENIDRNTIVSTLYALNNILFNMTKYHDIFFDLQGQIITLNVMRRCKGIAPIVRSATLLLKSVYPGLLTLFSKGKNSTKEKRPDRVTAAEEESLGHIYNRSTSQQDIQDSSDDEVNAIMGNLFPKSALKHRNKTIEDSDGDGDSDNKQVADPLKLVPQSTPTDTISTLTETVRGLATNTALTETARPQDSQGLGQSQEMASTVQFVPVDGGTIYDCLKNSSHFYEYHTVLPYRDNVTYHLWETDNIYDVKFQELAQIICGMLNVEGGTVFLGVSKTGCVQGLTLDRNTRDCIRLTLDRLNQQVDPTISHNQIHLNYVEVGQRTLDGEMKHLHNHYVIEIIIKAPWEFMFYSTGRPRVCYIRNHTTNTVLSEQDARRLIVLDEERHYLPKIQQLRKKIEEMEKELAEK